MDALTIIVAVISLPAAIREVLDLIERFKDRGEYQVTGGGGSVRRPVPPKVYCTT